MMLISCITLQVGAQVAPSNPTPLVPTPEKDSLKARLIRDTTLVVAGQALKPDSIQVSGKPDSVKTGDIKTTVVYVADDSVVFDARTKMARLYGKAEVTYGEINLTADKIAVDWTTGILEANGTPDSTGKDRGTPLFKQGTEKFAAKRMRYNFKTRKGVIREVITQQGEGYIHGETVKRESETAFFVKNAEYTTCNLEHPHFYIKSYKMKMVPGKKIISGPFNLSIADVPTPLGFLFGFFPIPKYKSSGIIIPTYGESADRGFFLRNGGYYLGLSDYFDLKLLGEIYSRGGYGIYPQTTYKKRYGYDGTARFFYNRRVYDTEGLPKLAGEDFWLDWTHTPVSLGTSRFSASVSVGSNRYNQRNAFQTQNLWQPSFTSSISYAKTFPNSPFSLTVSARSNQNVTTRAISLELPTVSLNMNRIYPFRKVGKPAAGALENLSVAYTLQGQNIISNERPSQLFSAPGVRFLVPVSGGEAVANSTNLVIPISVNSLPQLLRQARIGFQHNVPVATTVRLLKYFTLTPTLNYQEIWYPSRLRFQYDESAGADKAGVRVDTLRQFSRLYNFSTSANLTTQVYGTFFIRNGRVEAIRHRLNPTIGLAYRPDFSTPFFGFNQRVQTGAISALNPEGVVQYLNPYQSYLYGGAQSGRQGAVTFGLTNSVEAKVLSKSDSGKRTFDKLTLLDNLSIAGSYNLLADSFKLSPISIGANTRLFDRIQLAASTVLDPYAYENRPTEGSNNLRNLVRRRNYAYSAGQGLGSLQAANVSVGFSLKPGSATSKKTLPRRTLSESEERELDFINANPNLFVDFNIPYNLNVQYNAQYSKLYRGDKPSQFTQNVLLSGDISISPKWKFGASAPYDFQSRRLASTTINIYRDLHCWEMRLFVQLAGTRPMYTFDINVKASILQDLKLSKRNSFYDR
jgi:lipopolysaccharide assembly outer membrane protein LptD (OstA)